MTGAILRLGAYGNFQQRLNATQDVTRETIGHDVYGNQTRIDSVYENNQTGKIVYPASYGLGFTYQDKSGHWLLGADFEGTAWKQYSFFNESDQNGQLQNNWKIRMGSEYFPGVTGKATNLKYMNFVRYRVGFYYGPDYIKVNNNLPEYGITLGAGFPLKLRRTSSYETQSSILNTAIEIGGRGDKKSNLRENIFRLSIGLSLGDIWFRRAKYD